MALPRARRFANRRDIKTLLRSGRRFSTRLGRAVIAPAPAGQGRILFVVSSQVSKKSTERHRIKRQLDEWARRNMSGVLGRLDVFVLISPEAAGLKRTELLNLADDFHSHLRKFLP